MITIGTKTYGLGADQTARIVSRLSKLTGRSTSLLRSLVPVMLAAYREAVVDKGLPRWDPRVADSKRTAQYVQAQAGTDYPLAFSLCSVLYTLAKEGEIKPGVWDPAVAEKQAEARTKQAVAAVRRVLAPASEGAKDVGAGMFSAMKPILLLGALGLAAVVAVKFLPKREGA